MATRKTATLVPVTNADPAPEPPVAIALVDESEFSLLARAVGGRQRNTEYDGLVTQLHDSGKAAKITADDADVKSTVAAMRSSAKALFGLTVHARVASDGSTIVKLAEATKRPRNKPSA